MLLFSSGLLLQTLFELNQEDQNSVKSFDDRNKRWFPSNWTLRLSLIQVGRHKIVQLQPVRKVFVLRGNFLLNIDDIKVNTYTNQTINSHHESVTC